MRVLVTGGTGFVGSHSVDALLGAGHEVRMLVRAPERIARALDPLRVRPPEHAVGDVNDAQTVRRALDGCDAVLHAVNVFSFAVRDVARMRQDTRRGTEVVLTTAKELGLDPIVHVSSFVALLPSQGPLRPGSPFGRPNVPDVRYSRLRTSEQEALAPSFGGAGRSSARSAQHGLVRAQNWPSMAAGAGRPAQRKAVPAVRSRCPASSAFRSTVNRRSTDGHWNREVVQRRQGLRVHQAR